MVRAYALVAVGCVVGFVGLGCDMLKGGGDEGDTIKPEPKSAPNAKGKAASKSDAKGSPKSKAEGADEKPAGATRAVDRDVKAGMAAIRMAPANVAGDWLITSASSPGGGSYGGGLAIKKNGAYYDLAWSINSGEVYSGVALVKDSWLGVGWGIGGNYGVIVYKLEGSRLTGQWASSVSNGKLGTEVLEGSPDLTGDYKILQGISPDTGLAYTGKVKIVQSGPVHSFTWTLEGGESYQGAGIREGQWLIVGWGKGSGAGVVRYKVSGRTLSGVWAQPGGKSFGTENLTRK